MHLCEWPVSSAVSSLQCSTFASGQYWVHYLVPSAFAQYPVQYTVYSNIQRSAFTRVPSIQYSTQYPAQCICEWQWSEHGWFPRGGRCSNPSGILRGPRWFNINIIDFDRGSNMCTQHNTTQHNTQNSAFSDFLTREFTSLEKTITRIGRNIAKGKKKRGYLKLFYD